MFISPPPAVSHDISETVRPTICTNSRNLRFTCLFVDLTRLFLFIYFFLEDGFWRSICLFTDEISVYMTDTVVEENKCLQLWPSPAQRQRGRNYVFSVFYVR